MRKMTFVIPIALLVAVATSSAWTSYRSSEPKVLYYPFSWTPSYRLRKSNFDQGAYDLSSLFKARRGDTDPRKELETLLTRVGNRCGFSDDLIRIRYTASDGHSIWMDECGCREGSIIEGVSGTRLDRDGMIELRRLFLKVLPPEDKLP